MAIDPRIQGILNHLNSVPRIPMKSLTAEQFRARSLPLPTTAIEVKQVQDEIIALPGRDIPIRIYTPECVGTELAPGLIFYHGGGWVLGNIQTHDSICRVLANSGQCVVISVEYRLAPESKFPAAVDDAYDVLEWIAERAKEFGIDSKRIAVGGDSAGGNLAAVTTILAKEKKTPAIAYQFLLYPSTGFKEEPPSVKENAEGYFLTAEMLDWFREQYLNSEEEFMNPYFAPVLYHDLSGLPPAFIATAQFDPLRDVGKEYADKLRENGVPVTYKNFETLIHGFANFHEFVPAAAQALEECARQLQSALQTNLN